MELANKNNMLFFETSAKTSYNIDDVFSTSVKEISKKIDNGHYDLASDNCGVKQGLNSLSNTIQLENSKEKKKIKEKGCC
jgi:Ras-related protein Rab-2A